MWGKQKEKPAVVNGSYSKDIDAIEASFRNTKLEIRRILKICYISLGVLIKSDEATYHDKEKADEIDDAFHAECIYMLWEELLDIKSLFEYDSNDAETEIESDDDISHQVKNSPTSKSWKYLISDMERELLVEESENYRRERKKVLNNILVQNKSNSSLEDSPEEFVFEFIRDELVKLGLFSIVKRTLIERGEILLTGEEKKIIISDQGNRLVWKKQYDKLNDWFLKETEITPDLLFRANRKVEYFKISRSTCKAFGNAKSRSLGFSVSTTSDWLEQINFIMVVSLCKNITHIESSFTTKRISVSKTKMLAFNAKLRKWSFANKNRDSTLSCTLKTKKWIAHDFSKMYTLKMLPSHLLKAQNWKNFSVLINSAPFAQVRLTILGVQLTIKRFILDIQSFQNDVTEAGEVHKYESTVVPAYQTIMKCAICFSDPTTNNEIAIGLRSIGNSLTKMEFGEEAGEFYENSLKYARQGDPVDPNLVGDLLHIIANMCLTRSEYQRGLEYYEEALEIEKVQKEEKDVDIIVRYLDKIGLIYGMIGNHEKAIKVLEESLLLTKLHSGDNTMEVAKMMHKLAVVYSYEGNFEQSIQYNKEAVNIALHHDMSGNKEKLFVVKTYSSLGKLYMRLGDNQHALESFSDLINITEQLTVDAQIDYAHIYEMMGSIYSISEKFPEAIKCFQKELNVLRRYSSGNGDREILAKQFLGYAFYKNGDYNRAVILYLEVIENFKEKGNDFEAAGCLSDLGTCYISMGKWIEAIEAFKDSLSIRKSVTAFEIEDTNENQSEIADTLHSIGNVLTHTEQFDLSLRYFSEAYYIRKKLFGDNNADSASTKHCLGTVYFKLGFDEKAMTCFNQALQHRMLLFGENHQAVADTIQNIAFIHKSCFDIELALSKYENAYKIRQKVFGEPHDKLAESLYDLATVKTLLGEYKEALTLYENALRIFRELGYDDNEPKSANILDWIAFLRKQLVAKLLND